MNYHLMFFLVEAVHWKDFADHILSDYFSGGSTLGYHKVVIREDSSYISKAKRWKE